MNYLESFKITLGRLVTIRTIFTSKQTKLYKDTYYKISRITALNFDSWVFNDTLCDGNFGFIKD